MNRREFFKRLGIFVLALPFVKLFGSGKDTRGPVGTIYWKEHIADSAYIVEIELEDGQILFYASKDIKELKQLEFGDRTIKLTIDDSKGVLTREGCGGSGLTNRKVTISVTGLGDDFPYVITKQAVFIGTISEAVTNMFDLSAKTIEVKMKIRANTGYNKV